MNACENDKEWFLTVQMYSETLIIFRKVHNGFIFSDRNSKTSTSFINTCNASDINQKESIWIFFFKVKGIEEELHQ